MQTPEQAAAEIALLTRQHRYLQKEFNGKLIFAPIELAGRDLKILDVGCGSGLVLNDLHSQVGAGSELVGLDMNPAALAQGKAAAASKGIKLIQHDICDPLPEDLKNKFDVVHVRYTIYGAGRSGLDATVKNVASALKSGGWLQIQEHKMTTGRGGEAFDEYVEYFNTLLGKMGFKPDFCDALKPAYEAAGLTDVNEIKDDPTFGKGTADDAESIEIFTAWVPVLQQFGEQLFQMTPKSPDLYEKLRAELAIKEASFTRYIVIGRKP